MATVTLSRPVDQETARLFAELVAKRPTEAGRLAADFNSGRLTEAQLLVRMEAYQQMTSADAGRTFWNQVKRLGDPLVPDAPQLATLFAQINNTPLPVLLSNYVKGGDAQGELASMTERGLRQAIG